MYKGVHEQRSKSAEKHETLGQETRRGWRHGGLRIPAAINRTEVISPAPTYSRMPA